MSNSTAAKNNVKTIRVKLVSTEPMLIHSCEGVNPLHPITKAIKSITGKRGKTEDDLAELARLEYGQAIYHPDKLTILKAHDDMVETPGQIGPYIPAENIEACIREGAKKDRKGKDAQAAILVSPAKVPIEYSGPRDLKSLIEDPAFVDARPVVVNNSKVYRTRPRFNKWALEFDINYLSDVMDEDQVMAALQKAGALKGLGDFRPRYGRFDVIKI
jgi:hypothetical protein